MPPCSLWGPASPRRRQASSICRARCRRFTPMGLTLLRRDHRGGPAHALALGARREGDTDLILRVARVGRRGRDRRRAALPRGHVVGRRPRPESGRACSRSGREASGSGPGSSGRPCRRLGDQAARAAACCERLDVARARRSCWRRRSAASATGGTRSSTASRPTSRGRSRLTTRTTRTTPPGTTFHPTSLYEALWNMPRGLRAHHCRGSGGGSGPPALFSLTLLGTHSAASCSKQLRIDPSGMFWGTARQRVGVARALHRVVALLHLLAALRREAAEAPVPARPC